MEQFGAARILVVGDLMLDRYIQGTASRLSPEAPVPVLLHTSQKDILGGAANVAKNIKSLGGQCDLAGYVGEDEGGRIARNLCEDLGIGVSAVVSRGDAPTTLKTRVLSQGHQLLRIDQENTSDPTQEASDRLYKDIESLVGANSFDAIIVSDYLKGVTIPSFLKKLFALASARDIPVYVDPKGVDYQKYRGAAVIKPNRVEMTEFARRWGWPTEDLPSAAQELREALDLSYVALTLGDQGFVMVSKDDVRHIPTRAREVYDVTGAGDTVMAALVLCLSRGLGPYEAADVANRAAALAIGRLGSTAVSADELAEALKAELGRSGNRKVYSISALKTLSQRWQAERKTVVFTNGCFDIIHAGHTDLLQDAKSMGDRLIVGLNSDASIRRLKGEKRPLMPLEQRLAVLGALHSIDAIIVYEEDTPTEVIETLRPDIIVKGGDYDRSSVVGADFVESYGGRVEFVPITHMVSTTKIAAALAEL